MTIDYSLANAMTQRDGLAVRSEWIRIVRDVNDHLSNVCDAMRGDTEDWLWLATIDENELAPIQTGLMRADRNYDKTADKSRSAEVKADLIAVLRAYADSIIAKYTPTDDQENPMSYAVYDSATIYAVGNTINAAKLAAEDLGADTGDMVDFSDRRKLTADDEAAGGAVRVRRISEELAAVVKTGRVPAFEISADGVLIPE